MPAIFFLLAFFAIIMALTMVFRGFAVRVGGWSKAYQKLSKRYGAEVGYSRYRPWMSFNYGGSPCVVSNIGGGRKHAQTQVKISWPDRKLKLFISSFGEPTGIFKTWRLQPVVFDSDEKPDFHVYCDQMDAARELVTPTTNWKIQQLIRLGGESGIEIFLSGGQLRISKPGFIKNELLLDDFVRFGLELFDQFKLAVSEDLEFVPDTDVVDMSDVLCPICAQKLHSDFVVCVRCKTPHCSDCWEYNGQCAMFACNEIRFVRIDEGHGAPSRSILESSE